MAKQAEIERDFQIVANEAGERCVEGCREELEALDHARECSGDCEDCTGTGLVPSGRDAGMDDEEEVNCPACAGSGKCQQGADSDDPEAWHDEDRASMCITESPLSLEVRSGWHSPGEESEPEEYCILLGTGGPARRIVGDLEGGEPTSAHFEYQDWFKPWTKARLSGEDEDVLLRWAQTFYFGE